MNSSSTSQLNRTLARASFITSVGDFLSFFSVLAMIYEMSGSVFFAAYLAPVKSLGIAIGGATFPWFVSRLSARRVLVGTQVLSFFLMVALIGVVYSEGSYLLMGAGIFFQTVLKQYFDGCREYVSKVVGSDEKQRGLQAEILQALYSAQVIGPVLAFILIYEFGFVLPLWVDGLSFLGAAILIALAPIEVHSASTTSSIFRPFSYMRSNQRLRNVFLLRSVGYWVPVGIFNYFLFSVVTELYAKSILDSAWVYVAIGLGASVAALWLRTERLKQGSWLDHRHWSDSSLAATALLMLAGSRLLFLIVDDFPWAIFVVVVSGIFTGINAVTTQSLRRKLTTAEQFPEIVGLELVVGRAVDWTVATAVAIAYGAGYISVTGGVVLSALFLCALAVMQYRVR